jgi:hypothetical protein
MNAPKQSDLDIVNHYWGNLGNRGIIQVLTENIN